MINTITTICYLDTLPYLHKGRAVALGFFDGIHMGHQQIIRQTVKTAALEGLTSTVMTFINFNKTDNGVLTTLEEKRELLSALGVEELLVLDFAQVKDMPAEDFLNEIILMKLSARAILAGTDYRFGKMASGDAELLKKFGLEKGIEVSIFEDKLYGSESRRLSSTWLREAAGEGDVELYAKLCGGKCFSYSGMVVHGRQLGRQLGFPTANLLIPEDKFKVRRGVYVSCVHLGSKKLYGVTNVGLRPTVNESEDAETAETFIFDFDEDIYGARIKVELLSFVRPECRFSSTDELAAQVEQDKQTAKTWLTKNGKISPYNEV